MTDFTAQTMHQLIGHPNGLILEIGANECEDTVGFLAEMPGATIHCFEPDPRAIAKARTRQLPPNVHLYEIALSDHEGTAEFHQSDGRPPGKYWKQYGPHWDKSGSLLENDRHTRVTPWLKFLPPITVQCTTLDRWAAEHLDPTQEISFAWVDIQGCEAMMLRGAQETIKRLRFIYAECDPRPLYRGMAKLPELDALLPCFTRQPTRYQGSNFLWRNDTL